ncbi:hypothetical protein EV385_3010 [Krasilnikovia cinnamomea]|uniref:Uncharacterized protein n=1 Tax=Krasilnikovia cinnamomea TaxID=349313 RepID=A0A4Q7ZJW8_9ACTN|nr:hypothetical protein [Krasilnikovia cinnamomea]RZU51202.1 hypothetical protein EV385_3010 [Krasilnikovia cinnamomea]
MSDLGHERLVDRLLAHLERHSDDERLREMASGIRQGNASAAESLRASYYADALYPGLDGFAGWYQQLSESERAAHADQCRKVLDDLNEADTADRR